MKTWHKIALIGATAAGITGVAYYNAAKRLTFIPGKLSFANTGVITIQIQVRNDSRWAFPVPALNAGLFDNNDNYLGTVIANTWQLIPAGGGIITAQFQPNYSSVFSTLTNYATGTLPQHITITGEIKVGRFTIPFETKQSLSSGSAIGFTQSETRESFHATGRYKYVQIEHGKKKYSFIQRDEIPSETGKVYITVKDDTSVWRSPGKDFLGWDAAEAAYKNPTIKTMILIAQELLK